MAFKFRFRVLQQHRSYLLRKGQIALAAAQLAYDQIEAQKALLQRQIDEHILHWEDRQREGMKIGEYLAFNDHLKTLEQHLLNMDSKLKQAAFEVEKAKRALIEREKEAKIIDTLEETEKENYRYLQMKQEQKVLDEVATYQEFHSNKET